MLPEIATVPDGLAVSVPVKPEPSDIDTEMAATTVPAAALSGRVIVLGAKVTDNPYASRRRENW